MRIVLSSQHEHHLHMLEIPVLKLKDINVAEIREILRRTIRYRCLFLVSISEKSENILAILVC